MKDRITKGGLRFSKKGKRSDREKVRDDRMSGDKISVGNISRNKGVAIGRGARVEIKSGINAEELSQLFAPVYQKIGTRPSDPLVEKEEITDQVERIEKEVASGERAEPAKIERWLKNLAAMAPDILDVTLAALTSPVAGISMTIRKIAQKVKEEMQ